MKKKLFLVLFLVAAMLAFGAGAALAAGPSYDDGAVSWSLSDGKGSGPDFTCPVGTTLTATAATGYTLGEVTIDGSTGAFGSKDGGKTVTGTLNKAGNVTVTVNYSKDDDATDKGTSTVNLTVQSDVNTLKSVTSDTGSVTLSGTTYTVHIASDATANITLNATDDKADITFSGGYPGGTGKANIALVADDNVTATVTSEYGSTKDYTIKVVGDGDTAELNKLTSSGSGYTFKATVKESDKTVAATLDITDLDDTSFTITLDPEYKGSNVAYIVGSNCKVSGNKLTITDVSKKTATFTVKVTPYDSTLTPVEYKATVTVTTAASSFEDISMKVADVDKKTIISTSNFKPDKYTYSLDLEESGNIYLTVYYDAADFDVEVKYAGTTYDDSDAWEEKQSGSNPYNTWRIKVNASKKDAVTVKVTDDDNNSATYTFNVGEEESDFAVSIEGDDGKTYLSKSKFDAKKTSYGLGMNSKKVEEVTLYFYGDKPSSVKLGNSTKSVKAASGKSYDYYVTIAVDSDDETITVKADSTTYKFNLWESGGDYAVSVKGSDNTTYLAKSKFDAKTKTYDLGLSNKVTYVNLYFYDEKPSSVKLNGSTTQTIKSASDESYDYYCKVSVKSTDTYINAVIDGTTYRFNLWTSGGDLTGLGVYNSSYVSLGMTPAFSNKTTNYVCNVANNVSQIYLYTKASGSVQIAKDGSQYQTKSTEYTLYSLNNGLNVFDVYVGSEHYYVNVYRAYAQPTIQVSSQFIQINGAASRQIAAYNINGNNFVKLRDLAYLLNGTSKQFSIGFNATTNTVTMTSGGAYNAIGGEMVIPSSYKKAQPTKQVVYLDNKIISPAIYNIDGNNYFLLRDMANLLDFYVTFSGSTASIDTTRDYGGDKISNSNSGSSKTSSSDYYIKVVGDSKTYLDEDDFDMDDTKYDLDMKSSVETVKVYVYCTPSKIDTPTVKLDGAKQKVSEKTSYYLVTVDVDSDDDEQISVAVDGTTYKLNLWK